MTLALPLPFWRASGAGNDFLALAEPAAGSGAGAAAEPSADQVRAWCRRGLGLGADGVFVLRRRGDSVAPGPGATPPSDSRTAGDDRRAGSRPVVEMVHFNADGGRAELCINGTRCAARLAFELGWATHEVEILTGAGPILARDAGPDRVALELAAPDVPEEVAAQVDGEVRAGWSVRVGVPHFVLVWTGEMATAPVAELGPSLRRHGAFGDAGTNVDFVRYPAVDRFEVRSFERGVEAETLACGSGVLAAAAAGRRIGALELPAVARTAGGFEMEVAAGGAGRWSLAADARLLVRGEILPGAEVELTAPGWS